MTAGAIAALAVAVLGAAGCAIPMGEVPGLLGPEAYAPAMVLATGAEGEDCTVGVFRPAAAPELARAVARAVATVPEATLLVDVHVEASGLTTGVYNRRCVRVHGSAARLVSQLVVPGHGEHRSHEHQHHGH